MAMLPLFFFIFQTLIFMINGARVSPPAPVDCTSALMDMTDCLTFIESGSTVAKPENTCCSGLEQVAKKNVECLCQTFSLSKNMGVSLDVNKTLSLPTVCNVKTPPFSQCNISLPGTRARALSASSPVSSPTPSDEDRGLIPGETWPVLVPNPKARPGGVYWVVGKGLQLKISPFTLVCGFAATLLSYHCIVG